MPKNIATLRFGIGSPTTPQSTVWRLWVEKPADVYMAVRSLAGKVKFSLHASGICRKAVTAEYHGAHAQRRDRAMYKWRRAETPSPGSNQPAIAMWIAFPTDFLSAPTVDDPKVVWIDAAPPHEATFFGVGFSRESEEQIRGLWTGSGKSVVRIVEMRDEEKLLLLSHTGPWDNDDLLVTGGPAGQELVFAKDAAGTGRPIRIFVGGPPKDGETLRLTELGGYPRDRGTQ